MRQWGAVGIIEHHPRYSDMLVGGSPVLQNSTMLALLAASCIASGCNKSEPGSKEAAREERMSTPPQENLKSPDEESVADAPVQQVTPRQLAKSLIIVDGHIDLPYRLQESRRKSGQLGEDVSTHTQQGDFDHPRAVAGGLDAAFMSIYVPVRYQDRGGAKELADSLIDMVESIVRRSPDKFALALSPADIRRNFAAHKVSLPFGIENGAAIEDDLANLQHFHGRGVRYITLTHFAHNRIGDSSGPDKSTHGGLSKFGREVVAEMNRLGIMVDVSHVSEATFYQVLKVSKVPVIASHSSARHFTPGFGRNLSDAMIKALARNGGVMMVNFGSSFINDRSRRRFGARRRAVAKYADEHKLERHAVRLKNFKEKYHNEHPPKFATVEQVADHIDHVVKLVGIDHVGFGSDFEGVGDTLPKGLKDVADYPNLLATLMDRGYREPELRKLCGENLLRVWQAAQDHATAGLSAP